MSEAPTGRLLKSVTHFACEVLDIPVSLKIFNVHKGERIDE